MAGSSSNSPKPTCSFSMTGDRKNSMMTSGVICLRSLQTQLWPMPSWTASFTTPIA